MKSVNKIIFSPTNTTKRIVNSIVSGLDIANSLETDITLLKDNYNFEHSDLVIIGVPVYSGRIPEIVNQRLENLEGNNRLAVVVTVYGNREFDDALIELKDLMENKGFNVISAAAFIGEHSYSTSNYNIAENRPDYSDLQLSLKYGKDIKHKIDNILNSNTEIEVLGSWPYKERKKAAIFSPITNKEKCTNCMDCIDVCPTNAIDKKDPLFTDATKCIKCAACIKICKTNAKAFEHESIIAVTQKLYNLCKDRKEPTIFI